MSHRVGLGTDRHRLEAGMPLVIGGVVIPSPHGAVGHSDADVALHAVSDALLGAIAAGDIGELFPDTDPANRGLDSTRIVTAALERVKDAGFEVVNCDVVVHLQSPRLLPHRDAIVGRLAELLEVERSCVSFKAKTGEGVGDVGTGLVIEAMVVVLVERTL